MMEFAVSSGSFVTTVLSANTRALTLEVDKYYQSSRCWFDWSLQSTLKLSFGHISTKKTPVPTCLASTGDVINHPPPFCAWVFRISFATLLNLLEYL